MKNFLTGINLNGNDLINANNLYTKTQIDEALGLVVPTTTKINGKELSSDINLTADDLGVSSLGKYAINIGNGTNNSFTITHNLGVSNVLDIVVSIYEVSTKAQVYTDITIIDSNSLTVSFTEIPTSNQYRIVIIG